MPTANFIPGKISDLTGAPWLSMRALGGVDDGTTDNTAIVQAALTAMGTGSGGVLYFERPAVSWRINGQLTIPNTGGANPQQKSIRLTGEGPSHNGQAGVPNGGSILDLRYAGADAKILTLGLGFLEIDHLTLRDAGSDSTPFILTTYTTLHVHNVEFHGNPSHSGTSCAQDAIILGGTTIIAETTPNAPFQGYGSVISDCYFNRIRRAVYGRTYCNAIQVVNNTVWNQCGSNLADGAAIEFLGHVTNACSGNYVAGNLIEMPGYPYGIKCQYTNGIALIANNFYDPTATVLAYHRFDINGVYNLVIAGYSSDAYPLVSDASTGQRNTVISMHQSQESRFSEPVAFANDVFVGSANGVKYRDASGNLFFAIFQGTNKLDYYYQPNGAAAESVWATYRASATDKRVQIKGTTRSRLEAPDGGNFELFSTANEATYIGDPSKSFYVLNGSINGRFGVATLVKAGTPSDADFTSVFDGMMVGDSSGSKFWIRLGGVWKSVTVA